MKLHQQGNEIIVTELRPMSELKPGQYAICYRADYSSDMLKRSIERNDSLTDSMGDFYWPENIFIGYIPVPKYQPEATPIDPEGFRKGVKALFDYLQDRVANNYHANSDQMAELQKMNKVFEDWLSDALREVSEDDYNEWLDIHAAYAAGAEKYKRSHELYEKLRKLNQRRFSELFEAHLNGDASFDELVAKLP